MKYLSRLTLLWISLLAVTFLLSGPTATAQEAPPLPPDQVAAPEIVGGEEATPGDWPWMAAILSSSITNPYYAQFCGGSLISPEWVLTAAHCTYSGGGSAMQPSAIDVGLGIHKLSEGAPERIRVAAIHRHPNYNASTLNNDIALLRLSQASNLTPIDWLRANQTALTGAGNPSTVIGWGDTRINGNGSYADALMQVTVPLVSQETCRAAYGNSSITDGMICAGLVQGGKDACFGDSGGPLMVRSGGNWLQAGVVSWGDDCALPGKYGVYARVTFYDAWIRSVTGLGEETPTATPTVPTPTPTVPTPTPTVPTPTVPTATPTSMPPSPTATPTQTPPDVLGVQVANVQESSFTITWLTREEGVGRLLYAASAQDLAEQPMSVTAQGNGYAQQATVTGLLPQTQYYFQIAGDPTGRNAGSGQPWSITTGPTIPLPASDTVYGQLIYPDNSPAQGCALTLTIVNNDVAGSTGESAPLATLSNGDGYWSLNLGNARRADLAGSFLYSPNGGDLLALHAQCGPDKQARLTVDTGANRPVESITVGDLMESHLHFGAGWTAFSLPVDPISSQAWASDLCAESFGSEGKVIEVVRWEDGGWEGHICGVEANDFALTTAGAYFVRTARPQNWLVSGSPVTSVAQPPVSVGWNGINPLYWGGSQAGDLCQRVFSPFQAAEVDRWWAGGWQGHLCGLPFNNFGLESGAGYFVKVDSAEALNRQRVIPATAADLLAQAEGQSGSIHAQILNLRDSSATVAWQSGEASRGYVALYAGQTLLAFQPSDQGEARLGRLHTATLTHLLPGQSYRVQILTQAGDGRVVQSEMSFTTLPVLSRLPQMQTAYGQVLNAQGEPVGNALVTLSLQPQGSREAASRSLPLGVLTNASGYWSVNLGNARSHSGESFLLGGNLGEIELLAEVVTEQGERTSSLLPGDQSFPAPPLQLGGTRLYLPAVSR